MMNNLHHKNSPQFLQNSVLPLRWLTLCSVLLLTLINLPDAKAFPEMIRHGYVNCTVCHTSLVGGNLLTPYGRSLSKELLSQPTLLGRNLGDGTESLLHGFAEPPEWLTAGGDLRLLQTMTESKQASKGRFMIMQVDLDFSAQVEPHTRLFASLGRIEPRVENATAKDYVTSPRYGFEYVFKEPPPDSEVDDHRIALRVGRLMPAYGILFAEHTFASRSYLDFGPGQERTAAELSWTYGMHSLIATAVLNQNVGNQNKKESGGILQASTALARTYKIGLNYYDTLRDDGAGSWRRKIYGVYGLLGFTPDWYLLFDLNRPQRSDGKWGIVETTKLGHELWQGFHVFAVHEFANLNSEEPDPKYEAYSLGTQWYPAPHWELYGTYRRERNSSLSQDFQDALWFLGHYYL